MNYLFRLLALVIVGVAFESSAQTVVKECKFSAPSLSGLAGGYTQIAVPDCSVAPQPGVPQIPFRTVKLLLPAGASVNSVGAEPLSASHPLAELIKVDFGRTPCSPAVSFAGTDEPDPAIYSSTNAFPASAVELVSVQRMDGYDIAILRVYPVRYTPVPGRLVFTPELRITVFLNGVASVKPLAYSEAVAATSPSEIQKRLAAFVDNPELLPQASKSAFLASDAPVRDSPSSYDYLIVSSAELMPHFQPLIDLKVAAGLSVKTETMTNIVTNYSGIDSAEKLRNFIRDAHTTWGVQYVLLGGDAEVVPVRGVYGYVSATEKDNTIPCDQYFACLDGSWNSNSNTVWGEPADNVDLLAEVYVGRAPVATPSEVTNFVAKTIASQTASSRDFWAVFAAEYLDSLAQGGDALDYILPAFRNSRCRVEWLDDRPQFSSTWNSSNIISLLNRSPLFVAHSGHADIDTVMRLQQSNVDSLTNQFPFVLYSTGCDPGRFDDLYLSPGSIGEELIKRNQHGAFSAILNSRLGWYDPQNEWKYSGEFQAEFFNNLLKAGHSIIGKADRQSREALIGKVETSGSMPYRWCYFDLILFGDPHAAVEIPIVPIPSVFIIH